MLAESSFLEEISLLMSVFWTSQKLSEVVHIGIIVGALIIPYNLWQLWQWSKALMSPNYLCVDSKFLGPELFGLRVFC